MTRRHWHIMPLAVISHLLVSVRTATRRGNGATLSRRGSTSLSRVHDETPAFISVLVIDSTFPYCGNNSFVQISICGDELYRRNHIEV